MAMPEDGTLNYGGRHLNVILEEFWSRPTADPDTNSAPLKNGTNFQAFGLGLNSLWDIQDTLNFTLQILLGCRQEKIHEGPNGTVIGGEGTWLLSGEADVTYPYHLSPFIAKHFTYLHPVDTHWDFLFFKEPEVILFRSVIMDPFNWRLWLCLLVAWVLIALACYAICKYGNAQRSFCGSIMWIFCTISGKSYPMDNVSNLEGAPLKWVIVTANMLSFVILSVYTALVISTLSLKPHPIKKLTDLLDYKYEFIGFPEYPHPDDFTNDKAVAAMMKEMTLKNFRDFADSVSKALTSGPGNGYYATFEVMFGFWMNAKVLNFTAEEICALSYFRSISRTQYAMLVRKGSPLKEVLNLKILQIMESGVNKRHETHFLASVVSDCPDASHFANYPINITDIAEAFYGLIFGMAVGVGALIVEKFRIIRSLPVHQYTK